MISTKFLNKSFSHDETQIVVKRGNELIDWDSSNLTDCRIALQKHYDSISNSQAVRLLGIIAALFTFIQITKNTNFIISLNNFFELFIYVIIIFILIFFSFRAFFRFAVYSNFASHVLWVKEKEIRYMLEDYPNWREHNTIAILHNATFFKIAGLLRCEENKKYKPMKIYRFFPYFWFVKSDINAQKWGYILCGILTMISVLILTWFLA